MAYVEKRVARLEERWHALWRSAAIAALVIVGSAVGLGIGIGSRADDLKNNTKTVKDHEKRIVEVEEAIIDHAAHLEDLLAGQQAIADAVGAKLPKRTIRVKGAPR